MKNVRLITSLLTCMLCIPVASADKQVDSPPVGCNQLVPGTGEVGFKYPPSIPPSNVSATQVLSQWLLDCKRRLKRSWSQRQQELATNQPASYVFQVGKDGYIYNLKLVQTSGSKAVDETVLQIIKDASPLHPSVNYQPYQRGILVEFFNYPNLQVTLAPAIKT